MEEGGSNYIQAMDYKTQIPAVHCGGRQFMVLPSLVACAALTQIAGVGFPPEAPKSNAQGSPHSVPFGDAEAWVAGSALSAGSHL